MSMWIRLQTIVNGLMLEIQCCIFVFFFNIYDTPLTLEEPYL